MTDRIEQFLRSNTGAAIASKLGLVVPDLVRCEEGRGLPTGTVVCGGGADAAASTALRGHLIELGINSEDLATADIETRYPEGNADKCVALIYDGRACKQAADLADMYQFFKPMVRRLSNNGRIIVIASPHDAAASAEHAAAQRSLEGFTRSLAKEIGNRGSTAQLMIVEEGADHATRSTLSFLLSSRSAYIDGQVIRVQAGVDVTPAEPERPLDGQVVIVTGAARGIGESIARKLAMRGAKILGVDIPPASEALSAVMASVGGEALDADITAADAPQLIADKAKAMGGAHAVVHNAGVTRDKLLVNMSEQWWNMTLEINLAAAQRINTYLLENGGLNDNGRIIGVASMVGISGQRGQTNYSTSKAGVIGYVDYMANDAALRARGITVNAVAPGFIETQMTAAIPVLTREIARRLNSLSQGGQPEDVAEAIAWFANPGSAAINGVTLRVCGQNWIGA